MKTMPARLLVPALLWGFTACWGLETNRPPLAFAATFPSHRSAWLTGARQLPARSRITIAPSRRSDAFAGVQALSASGRQRGGESFLKRASGGITLHMGEGIAEMLSSTVLKRVIIWVLFGALLYACKPFYGVIIGTFVMSFVGNSVVNTLERQVIAVKQWALNRYNVDLPTVSREVLAIFYIIVVLNVLIAFTVVTVPQVVESWRYLKQIMLSDNPYVELANSICGFIGPDGTARLEGVLATLTGEAQRKAKGVTAPILVDTLQTSLKGYVLAGLPTFNKLLRGGTEIFYQLMVSLLFSSICIYDKRSITRGVQALGNDKSIVRSAYQELAPRISFFGRLVGKSLEAQLLIASWNTFLTTAGLFILRIPAAAALSILVFFCSFIPGDVEAVLRSHGARDHNPYGGGASTQEYI